VDVFIFTKDSVFVQVGQLQDRTGQSALLGHLDEVFGGAILSRCTPEGFHFALVVSKASSVCLHDNEVGFAFDHFERHVEALFGLYLLNARSGHNAKVAVGENVVFVEAVGFKERTEVGFL
jgi:hypothetical protein